MKSVAKAITRASSSAATRNGKLRLFTADSSETETYYGNFRSKADEEFVQIQRPSSIPPTILERTNLGPATQQLTPNSDSLSLSSQVDYTLFESSIFDRERDSHGPISLKIVVVLVGTFVVN